MSPVAGGVQQGFPFQACNIFFRYFSCLRVDTHLDCGSLLLLDVIILGRS